MDEYDLESRLERLARQPAPPISETFADGLESHLRVSAAKTTAGSGTGTGARRPLWQPLAGVILAAVILLAGSIALLRAQNSDAEVLVLSAAQETDVILPDGTTLVGNVGLPLPNGTRIEVAGDGSATINDVILAGGSVAVVVENRLEIVRDAIAVEPTATSTVSSPPTTVPDRAPERSDASTPTIPTTSADPPRTSTTRNQATSTVPPGRSTTIRTTPERVPPSTAGPFAVVLTAGDVAQGTVPLQWTTSGEAAVAGWEVVAQRGDAVRTIAFIRDPLVMQLTVSVPEAGQVQYQVLARAAGGAVVGESNQIVLTAP